MNDNNIQDLRLELVKIANSPLSAESVVERARKYEAYILEESKYFKLTQQTPPKKGTRQSK